MATDKRGQLAKDKKKQYEDKYLTSLVKIPKPVTQPREGDYVPGKGILNPYGGYTPTASEKTLSKEKISTVKPASPSSYANSSTFYGAGGKGEYILSDEEAQTLADAAAGGASGSEYGDVLRNPSGYRREPTLTKQQSTGLAKEYGLQGMYDTEFLGLTQSQARAKAQQIREGKLGQVSQNTSFAFNPQTISGFKTTLNDMKFKLDESNADPYTPRSQKKDKNAALISSYTDQLAGLFNTPDEFTAAQSQSPDFQKLLKQYEKMGGMATDIQAKIGQSQVSPYASDVAQYQNVPDQMSVDQYLGEMTSPQAKLAQQELFPEQQIAQQRIAFEQSIPEQYRQYYFGTPDQVGLVQRQKKEAEETIKLLERKAKLEEENGRAQANYLMEKNNAELAKETAEVEENRLAAKNYMTGMLAKLGALKTTGAAPQAMVKIEQKYQKQAQDLRTSYSLANKQLEIKLNELLDDIELTRDEKILKTKQDLSKSEEEIWKEIAKAQIDADRKTFEIVDGFTADFRRTKESYRKELEAEAKKYANSMANTISAYDLQGIMEGDIALKRGKTGKIAQSGILTPTGELQDIEKRLEANAGVDGKVNPHFYNEMWEKFKQAGGTRKEFTTAYPPKSWVNPKDDPKLPDFLQYKQPSQTESASDSDGLSFDEL